MKQSLGHYADNIMWCITCGTGKHLYLLGFIPKSLSFKIFVKFPGFITERFHSFENFVPHGAEIISTLIYIYKGPLP